MSEQPLQDNSPTPEEAKFAEESVTQGIADWNANAKLQAESNPDGKGNEQWELTADQRELLEKYTIFLNRLLQEMFPDGVVYWDAVSEDNRQEFAKRYLPQLLTYLANALKSEDNSVAAIKKLTDNVKAHGTTISSIVDAKRIMKDVDVEALGPAIEPMRRWTQVTQFLVPTDVFTNMSATLFMAISLANM